MTPARQAFEYAVLRAVPRVDRGEFVNVGVVLYCQAMDFLAARSHIDPTALADRRREASSLEQLRKPLGCGAVAGRSAETAGRIERDQIHVRVQAFEKLR